MNSSDAGPERRELWDRFSLALVVAGVAFRLAHLLGNRSLWLDELSLALNLREKSFVDLLTGPLENHQMAPLGFLWATKLVTIVFGYSEISLRIVPFFAGLVALLQFRLVARRLVGQLGAVAAIGLVSLSPAAIYFAAEFKQYSVDLAASVLIISLTLRYANTPSLKALLCLATSGTIVLWLSYAVAFVLFGAGCGLTARFWRDRRDLVLAVAATCVMWLLSFAVHVSLTSFRDISTFVFMQDFWNGAFMPRIWNIGAWARWMWHAAIEMLEAPLGMASAWTLAALFALYGVVALFRREPWLVVFFVAPPTAALVASAGHLYPFAGRFLFFLLPILALLLASGIEELRQLAGRSPAVTSIALAILLVTPFAYSFEGVTKTPPYGNEETRPIWENLRREMRDGDAIYVSYATLPSLRYYASDLRERASEVIVGPPVLNNDWAPYRASVEKIAVHPRVWAVFSQMRPDILGAREDLLALDFVGRTGTQPELSFPGALLYRLSFDSESGTRGR